MKPGIDLGIRHSKLFVTAIALATFAPSAFAYLDPSTGSMILSAIVGIFATVGLALKTYWYKMKALFVDSKSVQSDAKRRAVSGESATNAETDSAGRQPYHS